MQRRSFIRIIGGGTIIAATGFGLTGCASMSEFPAASVADWTGPADGGDVRRWALSHALLAPSPHNRQQWLVSLSEPDVITLFCDVSRALPHTDPFGRQVLIGHGCFLEILRMALTERGYAGDVRLFPDGEVGPALRDIGAKPIARITLQRGGQRDPLFVHVMQRHTQREPHDLSRTIPADALTALRNAAEGFGVQYQQTTDQARIAGLRKLAMDAARIEVNTERTMMESVHLIRIGPDEIMQHRDGISVNDAFARFAVTFGLFDRTVFPPPGSTGNTQTLSRYEASTGSANAMAWISTAGNSRTQQVQAGRAYVRTQLAGVPFGLGMQPLSQGIQEFPEMKSVYDQLHHALVGKPASAETVQMLYRVGYPTSTVGPSPRRGVAAIIKA